MQAGSLRRFGPHAIEIGQKCGVAGIERFQNKSIAGEALPRASRGFVCGFRAGKILRENFAHGAPLRSHCRRTLLTETHAMPPAASMKGECISLAAHFKPCAGNAAPSQRLAHSELEVLGGNFGPIEQQSNCTPRCAAPRDGQILPSGLREAVRGKSRG